MIFRALSSEADVPQLFITRAIEYFYADNLCKNVSVRMGIVREIIITEFDRGII